MINLYEDEKSELNAYWEYKEGLRDSYSRSYLGNFINMLISYTKITKAYTEYNSQFYSLISKFARLGQEARHYLLKARMVGRIIAFYHQDASAFGEFFGDFSDVAYEESTNVEIGVHTRLENIKLSLWEDIFIKKRDGQVAMAQQDYTHLFETLSYLVRSCVFKATDASTFIDDLRYDQLHENEYISLELDDKDIGSLLDSCTNKQSSKHLGSILLHLCNNNREFDTMLRTVLVSGIMDKQLDELKAYFPTFKRYLFIQDEYTEDRINDGIREYFNVLRNNTKYPQFMARFTTYLVKLININRGVAEVLASCPEEWDWILEWIKKNPCPSKGNQQFKNHAKEYAVSQYKLKRLEDTKNGNIETFENEYDSDDDMVDHKFVKEEKIDYQTTGHTWVSSEVVIVLDEMIHAQYFSYNQTKSHWFAIDHEVIAPHLSMQNRHDIKIIEENRIEVEAQFRKNVQQQEESGSAHVMSESERYNVEAAENDSVSD